MGAELRENEPLARYTGWRVGGPARFFATAACTSDLVELVHWGSERELPIFILGGGTNILVADGGFPGLVIRNRAPDYRLEACGDEATLHIASGAPMAGTARRMAGQGWGGLTWAEGLPGAVGGAIYGNAGCYGGDTAGSLLRATLLRPDGAIETWERERFRFRYRGSMLKPLSPNPYPPTPGLAGPVVLEASLRLQRGAPEQLAAEMAVTAAERRGKTPSGSSCGSSFKNPPGTTAGYLLDQAGLKGTRAGRAVVSQKHANYIVNEGGATAADILRLTEIMRERVLRAFGVELELEVQIIGAIA